MTHRATPRERAPNRAGLFPKRVTGRCRSPGPPGPPEGKPAAPPAAAAPGPPHNPPTPWFHPRPWVPLPTALADAPGAQHHQLVLAGLPRSAARPGSAIHLLSEQTTAAEEEGGIKEEKREQPQALGRPWRAAAAPFLLSAGLLTASPPVRKEAATPKWRRLLRGERPPGHAYEWAELPRPSPP